MIFLYEIIFSSKGSYMKYPNRVREFRTSRGYARDVLAERAGITRQSLGLIEAGRVSPSTATALKLADILRCTVECLFSEPRTTVKAPLVPPQDFVDGRLQRVYLARLNGELRARSASIHAGAQVGLPVQGIMQHVDRDRLRGSVQLLQSKDDVDRTVFVSGCDLGLNLFTNYVHKSSSAHQGVWFNVPNQRALDELRNGHTHIAVIHQANHGVVQSAVDLPFAYKQFHFAEAELGFILPKGNPKGVRHVEDMACGLRIVNRQPGSGARLLLDQELIKWRIDATKISGYSHIVNGHLEVGFAVKNGIADVGIGHAGAAALLDLDFHPIQAERTILIVPEPNMELESIQVLLNVLNSDTFRAELSAFGPYGVFDMGKTVE
jgi:putative molybdopterin biosynthesis protein